MPNRRDQAGFTLLEAMIAMAIVALVVSVVLSIRTNALIDAAEARKLIRLRQRTGRLLVVAFPGSLSPAVQKAICKSFSSKSSQRWRM